MAKVSRLAGSASHILQLFIQDSSVTTGAGLAGLTAASAGLTAYYKRNAASASVAITLTGTGTLGTYTSGLFKEIDATNMPGWYEFHPPDAAYAAGSKTVGFHLRGATNMVPVPLEVELTAVDNQDATRFGLTALPNAAAGANAGLPVLSSSATTLAYTVSTLTTYTGNTPQTGDNFARLGAPAGASVSADVAAIQAKTTNLPAAPASTTNITAATGVVLAGVTHTGATIPTVTTTTTTTNLTNAPTAGDFTATMKTSLNAATPTVTAGTVSDKTGYALTAAYDPAKTAAQAGAAMALTSGERTTLAGVILADTTDTLGADIVAIKAKTDNLPASPAAVGSAMTLATGAITGTVLAGSGVTAIQAGLATPTNITAGTITTVTTLTNLPTIPTDWIAAVGVSAAAVTKIQAGLSTYAGADTAGTTTLLSRVTGAVALASQIPANFTTATFASAGVFSVGALANAPTGSGGGSGASLVAIQGELDARGLTSALTTTVSTNLNATVSSRSTYAGGPVASVTAPVTAGTVTDKTGYSLNFAQVGLSPRALDSVGDSSLTLGDALVAGICGAAGKESISGTTYTVKTPSTGTVIRTFSLDSGSNPTSRT